MKLLIGLSLLYSVQAFSFFPFSNHYYPSSYSYSYSNEPINIKPVQPIKNEALFLTPYIENGDIAGGQRAAKVVLPDAKNVTGFGGYITINKQYNSNIYIRYFPAEENANSAPVISFNQGGPGHSSQISILENTGPMFINRDGSIGFRDCRWCRYYHMLYIDYPVNTGYSYTENNAGYPKTDDDIGNDLFTVISQFFTLFPDLLKHDYYAFGTSMGTKYITNLARVIDGFNKQNPQKKIPLKGLGMQAAFIDPISIFNHGEHLYQLGLIEKKILPIYENAQAQCHNLINQKQFAQAADYCLSIIDNENNTDTLFRYTTGYQYSYDFRQTVLDVELREVEVKRLNSPQIKTALHIGDRDFNMDNTKVIREYLKNEIMQSLLPVVEQLASSYRILFYVGQMDLMEPFTAVSDTIDKMNFKGKASYDRAERKLFVVDNEIAGYTKSSPTITLALIRNAGHNTPSAQPCWVVELLNRFIKKQI